MWHRSKKGSSIKRNYTGRKIFFFSTASGNIAKERLKLMMEAERQKLDDDTLSQIRQEIGSVITKYVDIEPENVEVKVMLKDYKKRE